MDGEHYVEGIDLDRGLADSLAGSPRFRRSHGRLPGGYENLPHLLGQYGDPNCAEGRPHLPS